MSDKFVSASKLRELIGIDPDGDCDGCKHWGRFGCGRNDVELACAVIDICPTADVVEVVRCKDCVSARPATGDAVLLCDAWSDEYSTEVRADGYCYLGEKKSKVVEIDQVKEDGT